VSSATVVGSISVRRISGSSSIKPEQRNAVIESVRNGFPLNSIYWVKNDDQYEMLDGQQRTISICQYVNGDFSLNDMHFNNLPKDNADFAEESSRLTRRRD